MSPDQDQARHLAEHGVYVQCSECLTPYVLRMNLMGGKFGWMRDCAKKCPGKGEIVQPDGTVLAS